MSVPQSTPVQFRRHSASDGNCSAEAKIRAIYLQMLKRNADAAGLEHYRHLLETGATDVRTIVRDLLHSDEWRGRFIDGRAVADTVLALYDCALARAPDVDGWNQLVSRPPANGWNAVIDSILDGAEYEERFGFDLVPGEHRNEHSV